MDHNALKHWRRIPA